MNLFPDRKPLHTKLEIRPIHDTDQAWIHQVAFDHWGSNRVVSRGRNFDTNDIGIWQGYSQDTETNIPEGKKPPEGYLNSANWHAKQTTKWVQPTAGFQLEENETIFGEGAGRWSDTTVSTGIVTTNMPTDWSGHMFFTFWAYSAEANDAGIELVAYSESEITTDDDYFKMDDFTAIYGTQWQSTAICTT